MTASADQLRMRYLQMAKQFNWSNSAVTTPSNHTATSAPNNTNISKEQNISFAFPANSGSNNASNSIQHRSSSSPSPSPHNQTSNSLSSQATLSEFGDDDNRSPFRFQPNPATKSSNELHFKFNPPAIPQHPNNQPLTANNRSFSAHQTKSRSNSPPNASILDLSRKSELSTNMLNLSTHSHASSSSLQLTEHNLSKLHLSQDLASTHTNKSPSKTPSESSVLSQHNFTLLEISSTSSSSPSRHIENGCEEEPDQKQEQIEAQQHPKIGNSKFNPSELDRGQNQIQSTNNRPRMIQTPLPFTHSSNFTHPSMPFTQTAFPSKNTRTRKPPQSGVFLDLCSSESSGDDNDDHQQNNSLWDRIMTKKTTSSSILTPMQTPNINKPNARIDLDLAPNNKKNKLFIFESTKPTKTKKAKHIQQPPPNTVAIKRKKHKRISADSRTLCDETLSSTQFKKQRDDYTFLFFTALNERAFQNKLVLNGNVTYAWCKTLNKTAGDCRLMTKNNERRAHIRLATKVLDTLEKLKQTFCHEMCHAMAWIVHATSKPPHGSHFKYWANQAELAFDDIRVTTCHNYKIQYKFQWQCSACKYVYGRHSKSINIETHRCGVCKGKLAFLGRLKSDGSFAKSAKKAPSAFTVFMKEHMADIKRKYPAATHGEVMRILSEKYKQENQK